MRDVYVNARNVTVEGADSTAIYVRSHSANRSSAGTLSITVSMSK